MTQRDPAMVEELIQATLEFMAFRGSPNPATAVPYMRWRQAMARLEPDAVRDAEAELLTPEPVPPIRRQALEEAMQIAQSVGASVAAGSIEALIHREDRDGTFYVEHVMGHDPVGNPTPHLLRPEFKDKTDMASMRTLYAKYESTPEDRKKIREAVTKVMTSSGEEHDWHGVGGEAAAVLYECTKCEARKLLVSGQLRGTEPGPCDGSKQTLPKLSRGIQLDEHTFATVDEIQKWREAYVPRCHICKTTTSEHASICSAFGAPKHREPVKPDYSWVKVKRYVDDPSKTWEERYAALQKHHEDETTFLIEEVERLEGPWRQERDLAHAELRRLAREAPPCGACGAREYRMPYFVTGTARWACLDGQACLDRQRSKP